MLTDTASPLALKTPIPDRAQKSGARLIVQAETNLLRFPFFALHTKGLREVDFKEVRGTRHENGKTHEFVFRVSRNTDHVYPGPLSRKAHFALLSLLRQQGFPFQNPIAFTWRQLTREMQIAYGGATSIERLKGALLSTLGAMIKSSYALKSGESRETLPARERGYTLYTECLFTNDVRPDGTIADQNYVTLADWYLANLNSLYAAPVDYPLWNRLNERSPFASRLYEFLLFNFSTGIDRFVINYAKLCQFLPATVEAFASQAKEQLNPAFRLLEEEAIISSLEWTTGRADELQIRVRRGRGLAGVLGIAALGQGAEPDVFEIVTSTVGENSASPAERLVHEFHAAWGGVTDSPASAGEIEAAKKCLDQYGLDLSLQLLPKVVQRMKQQFPEAKTFGATRMYFQHAQQDQAKRERIVEKAQQAASAASAEEKQREARQQALDAAWEALPPAEQAAIRQAVLARNPRLNLEKYPPLWHRLCLAELDQRSG